MPSSRSRFFKTGLRLLQLALPLAAGMLFQVAFNLVDAYFIGQLGTDAFAAVNLASFSVWLLSAIVGIVGTGANSRVAQTMGAQKPEFIPAIRSQALRCSVILGIATTLMGLFFASDLTRFLATGKVQNQLAATLAGQYLSTIFLMAPVLCLNETIAALFRGEGDTRTPTLVLSTGFVLNAVLDPLLIFGYGPIPQLGVIGAALASDISFLWSLSLFVWLRRDWFRSSGKRAYLDTKLIASLARVGFPPSVTNIVFCLVYMMVTPHLASLGTQALAALGLGHKVISLSYFLSLSFSLAAITMTGESTGAEDDEEATHRSWVVVIVASCTNFMVGSLLVYNSASICALFSDDPDVVRMAVSYLWIVVPSQVLLGAGMSVEGSFAGFGRTTLPMIASVVSSVMRWPLVAVVVAKGLGTNAVWWVFASSTYLRGTTLILLLMSRRK